LFVGSSYSVGQTSPKDTKGVELPAAHIQFRRVYAAGHQNDICTMNADGQWHWLLDHPVAILRRYKTPNLNPETDPIVANHQHTLKKNFTVSTAIWTLDTHCDPDVCVTVSVQLYGTAIRTSDNMPSQALPRALVQTIPDEKNMGAIVREVTCIQRVDITNGIVPVTEICSVTQNGSHYNSNYTAHYIFARKNASALLRLDMDTRLFLI
jgi:hypothetical protein